MPLPRGSKSIATALRTARKYGRKYAEGGEVDDDGPDPATLPPRAPTRITVTKSDPPQSPDSSDPQPSPDYSGIGQEWYPSSFEHNVPAQFAEGVAHWAAEPGQIAKDAAQIPEMKEGATWSDEDEARRQFMQENLAKREADWGAGTALGMVGLRRLGPMQENSVGIGGGKLAKKFFSRPDVYDIPPGAIEKHFKQISPSQGTQPGGWFTGPDGKEFYVKQHQTLDQAMNEKLAAELYKEAGVPVGDVQLTQYKGKPAVATPKIDGPQLSKYDPSQYGYISDLHNHFPADAWLANWDVVGAGTENPFGNIIAPVAGSAHRIDFGGALRYRGLGGTKDFGPVPNELKTMLDPSINPSSAEVFGAAKDLHGIGQATVDRMAAIPENKIRLLVERYGPASAKAKLELADNLIKRRNAIAQAWKERLPDKGGSGPQGEPEFDPASSGAVEKPEITGFAHKDAKAMMEAYGSDVDKYADHLAEIKDKLPEHALNIVKELPDGLRQKVANGLLTKLSEKSQKPLEAFGQPQHGKSPSGHEYGFDAAQDAKELAAEHDGSPYQIAKKLYEMAKDGATTHVDEVLKHLPQEIHDDVSYQMSEMVLDKQFDPWHEGKFLDEDLPTPSTSERFDPAELQEIADKNFQPIDWTKYEPPHDELVRPHHFSQEQIKRLNKMGFNTRFNILKGGHYDDYPTEVPNPKDSHHEPAWFAGDNEDVAASYGRVTPYVAKATNVFEVNWPTATELSSYDSYHMSKLLHAAKLKNADLLIIHNIEDIMASGYGRHTQYAFLNTRGATAALRSPSAQFSEPHIHLANPLLGIAGGGIITFSALKAGEKPDQQKPDGLATGGAATGGAMDNTFTKPQRLIAPMMRTHLPRPPRAVMNGGSGMIHSTIPGRTDKIPMRLKGGSYIVPADVVSGAGQGNSTAGAESFNRLFKMGPYGAAAANSPTSMKAPHLPRMSAPGARLPNRMKNNFADGGADDQAKPTDIIVAGGEFAIPVEVVKRLGGGNISHGHDILDAMVLHIRKQTIKEMKNLKGPKR